jgi:L-threonylcarbamoyladenylate synthase
MGTRRRRVSVKSGRSKLDKWDDLRMEFISNCTAGVISNAAQALIDGHLVAFPTETVYGLGADATNEKAVSRIYSVKGRPIDHPLIVHISSMNKLDQWATDVPDYAIKLAREFWPGPMTLILPRTELAKDYITGGQANVGVRVPAQPIALYLVKKFEELGGKGIAAPSANRFGAVSPTTSNDVKEELGNYLNLDDIVLDGGQCTIGIESTIIDCTKSKPTILRPGVVTNLMISQLFDYEIRSPNGKSEIKVSGLLESHYAPKAKIVTSSNALVGEGFIALAKIPTPPGAIRLASPTTLEEFARDLYSSLRSADHQGLAKVSAIPPDGQGLAEAIRDRLIRASTGK